MSELILFTALLLAAVAFWLGSEWRRERCLRLMSDARCEAVESKLAVARRKSRQLAAPWQAKGALPAAREIPVPEPASEPLALEVAGLAFADPPPIIDLPHSAAHTEEFRLPKPKPGQRFPKPDPKKNLIDPTHKDHELFRPRWYPGTKKETTHAR